jgi:hypothetical protein
LPTLNTFTLPLPPAWLLIMHSDGTSARFAQSGPTETLPRNDQQFAY